MGPSLKSHGYLRRIVFAECSPPVRGQVSVHGRFQVDRLEPLAKCVLVGESDFQRFALDLAESSQAKPRSASLNENMRYGGNLN